MATGEFCTNCGAPRAREDAEFCGVCGAALERIPQVVCPRCGKPRKNAGAEFCGICGTLYNKVEVPQSAAGEQADGKPPVKLSGHHDVFISYSSKDKPIADAVVASIENNSIRCWIAPRDILPGEDFPKAIIRAINESKVMVLIFSASANASPQVTREVTKAVSKGIIIIPFRIEDAPMSESMEYLIGLPHWLDALTSPMEQHINTLVRRVKNLVEDHP
jgi:hypothetical protein